MSEDETDRIAALIEGLKQDDEGAKKLDRLANWALAAAFTLGVGVFSYFASELKADMKTFSLAQQEIKTDVALLTQGAKDRASQSAEVRNLREEVGTLKLELARRQPVIARVGVLEEEIRELKAQITKLGGPGDPIMPALERINARLSDLERATKRD